jgi:hypothetical protein
VQQSPSGGYYILWALNDESLFAGRAIVFRSRDSVNWQMVTKAPHIVGVNWYEDHFNPDRSSDSLFYKVVIYKDGVPYESPVGGLYKDLNAKEQGIVKRMLNTVLKSMIQGRQGIKAWLYKPLQGGAKCQACQTGTLTNADSSSICPVCFGTRIVGGYALPTETWIKRLSPRQLTVKDLQGGAGADDQEEAQWFSLPFPIPRVHDVLLIPATGEAHVVGQCNLNLFRGIVPISSMIQSTRLLSGDIRHRLPLPLDPVVIAKEPELPPYIPPADTDCTQAVEEAVQEIVEELSAELAGKIKPIQVSETGSAQVLKTAV